MQQASVYVVEVPGAVKIGVTTDLRARLAQLQTGSPHPLRLAWSLPIMGDAYAVEAEAHRLLDRHRVGGEWFSVTADVAVAAVSAATYRLAGSGAFDARRQDASTWLRRIGLVALAFAPTWTALTAGHALMAASLSLVGFVLLSAGLLRSRIRFGMGVGQVTGWFGAIGAGMAFAMALGLAAGSAHAAERPAFPSYDSEAYCSKVVAVFNDNPMMKEGCRSNEADAKGKLQRVWTDAPADIETQCLKLMGVGSPNNYQSLGGCVAMSVGNSWMNGTLRMAK